MVLTYQELKSSNTLDPRMITADGSLSHEVKSRINSAWLKWHITSSIMCDKKSSSRLKSKIYCTIVQPLVLYGAECWPAIKETELCLGVMETKML
ncbi:hypothetical protein JRQ81_019737 [Phrynocephalus forsythii]|uniref:Uncharacterized protein n=1 Tax=Phrynocephalus forsythii TaxID=171643 RepID=A0A9Q1AYT1_9SAUR|nr:hypothetical protein JRQ81_019737 [Phrynocephalus forsythii]